MSFGGADEDEENKDPILAGMVEEDSNNASNAAKLNSTLRKMEAVKVRKKLA